MVRKAVMSAPMGPKCVKIYELTRPHACGGKRDLKLSFGRPSLTNKNDFKTAASAPATRHDSL